MNGCAVRENRDWQAHTSFMQAMICAVTPTPVWRPDCLFPPSYAGDLRRRLAREKILAQSCDGDGVAHLSHAHGGLHIGEDLEVLLLLLPLEIESGVCGFVSQLKLSACLASGSV